MVKQLWQDVWQVLNTPIKFPLTDAVTGVAEAGKTVTELAKLIQENRTAAELAPLIGQMSSLLDVLSSPLVQVVGAGLPFVPLATGLLKYLYEQTRQEPSLEVGVAIVCQSAYLQSLSVFLEEYPEIRQKLSDKPASESLARRIRQIGEKLELDGKEFELTERIARDTLICFHESPLAQIFNTLLISRLKEGGLLTLEAERVADRISRSTHRYMKTIVAEVQDQVRRLAAVYGEGWLQNQETYASIDRYLETWIATRPQERVFDEEFCFNDIYVPLQVEPVDEDGKVEKEAEPKSIEVWAENLLQDPKKQDQVLFIQGGPGRGKSVFCRMFADKVRRDLHPIWTPVLIRLRDVRNFSQAFDKILQDAIGTDFTKDPGWLTDSNSRFLFLLDGFDELLLERGATNGLQQFLDQVSLFQLNCARISERQHRVLITGRPLALFGIARVMPPNLERVEILPMSHEIQKQWLTRWSELVGREKAEQFQFFLKNQKCPRQVKALATEPLLLYLLAALHRDGKLQESQFEGDDPVAVRIQIYEAVLNWVLTKQRNENGSDLNPKITGLNPEDLRSILAEAGLCVVQSGGEKASIAMIEERLKDDEGAKALLERARQQAEENPLKNALAAFYLKSVESSENQVEFFHKSFGEFLCAERLCESIRSWTERSGKRGKPFNVSDGILYGEIYDLLGFGSLTQEVVGYLMGLLKKSDDVDWVVLFQRLEMFYLHWCDGEFIDKSEETLPQRKVRQLAKYKVLTGQRQVDVATGLNILILLLELHRYAQLQGHLKKQVQFHPCGKLNTEDFSSDHLLRIISYSNSKKGFDFYSEVKKFFNNADLSGANLNNADLSHADLSGANLNNADLSHADLSGANLNNADLSHANLSGANLSYANLNNADLSHADLSGANFWQAHLSDAHLSHADLSGANLSYADLRGANLSHTDLNGANFWQANLSDTNLSDAHLSRVDLSHTDLSHADLSGAGLYNAVLTGANLGGANLSKICWNSSTSWGEVRKLHEVLKVPEELAQEVSFRAATVLSQGISWVQQGKVQEAIQAYQNASELDPRLKISDFAWAELCWFGSLYNQAEAVLFAGDKAVMLNEQWVVHRDTRGIARALSADFKKAIEDFQIVVETLEDNTIYQGLYRELSSNKRRQQRQEWLETLQTGRNPITAKVLAQLRNEAGLDGV